MVLRGLASGIGSEFSSSTLQSLVPVILEAMRYNDVVVQGHGLH